MNQDKSSRYHALKRRAAILSTAWSAALLLVLAATPASTGLAGFAARCVAALNLPPRLDPAGTVAVYVLLLGCLFEAADLPVSFYRGFILEHRYGLSTESFRAWLWDQAKAAGVGGGLSLVGLSLLYAVMRHWPAAWWVIAGAGFTLFIILMARLAPVILLPIFFSFKPLGREDLRRRLLELSRRAGVPVTDACEWQLSDRTKKGNAALTGLGRTRRILVSDTLLATHSEEEIEVVLAHELGHHAHHDIWKGVALESIVALVGFFLASRVLALVAPRLGWQGVADVAGLPVLLLVAGFLSLLLLPAVNGCSRAMERAADRFAFELTGNAAAFVSAMQRLGAMNLAEERPPLLARWLFYSHPPMPERIAAARRWEAERPRER